MAKWDHDDLRDKSDEYFKPPPGSEAWKAEQGIRPVGHDTRLDHPGNPVRVNNEPWEAPKVAFNVVQSRGGGRVERCHGIYHLGSYSNAMHQWGVAMLMWYLWPEDFPRLAIWCLSHDVPESLVGDIPAPTCRYVPGLREQLNPIEGNLNEMIGLPAEHKLEGEDFEKLKACDRLEFWLWSMEQVHVLGNKFAQEGLTEIERYFTEVPLPDRADRLFKQLKANSLTPVQAGMMKAAAGK